MTHVITGVCAGCKCANCAEMCPVDAFRESELMLVIDPDVCIDCEACVEHCTRGGIFKDDEVPEIWKHYIEINRRESQRSPEITEPQEPLGFPNWEYNRKYKTNHDSEA